MIGRRFYAAAAGVGACFASMGVAVPLQVSALGGQPELAGAILAAGTVAIACGALTGGALAGRLGGARTLALALAASGAGSLMLASPPSIAATAAAGVLVGIGIGMFWVASQLVLGRRSGDAGSASGFALHYAAYTVGAVAGSSVTGGIVALAEQAGLSTVTGIRWSSLVGTCAASAALALWRPLARREPDRSPAAPAAAPTQHLAVQVPDLLLVSALAFLFPLAPIVLADGYHFGPFAIGVVMAGISVAKIAGSLLARALARTSGNRRTILLLLAGAGALCLMLSLAFTAPAFVTILLATTLAATGAWPLVVDSAQARVPPEGRHGLTVVWNAREYAVIAVATLLAGRLIGAFASPAPLYAVAAGLIAAAALSAAVVTRRPVWRPTLRA